MQHAVTFAAGLACEGMIPFCAIYSSFLQRGYDQIVHDVALQSLPVRFAMDRAGLVGADGATHCGFADVTYMSCVPNMVVMAVRPLPAPPGFRCVRCCRLHRGPAACSEFRVHDCVCNVRWTCWANQGMKIRRQSLQQMHAVSADAGMHF